MRIYQTYITTIGTTLLSARLYTINIYIYIYIYVGNYVNANSRNYVEVYANETYFIGLHLYIHAHNRYKLFIIYLFLLVHHITRGANNLLRKNKRFVKP